MRCYNGCPDSELQALLDRQEALRAELRRLNPEARLTYFPMEGQWMAHIWGRFLSGMHNEFEHAAREGIETLRADAAA